MTTAITQTQKQLRAMVDSPSVKAKLDGMLGKRAPQFATSLLSLVNQNDMLAKCDPQSVLTAAMTAATLDLPIQKDLGFAWIVGYGTSAQFQMGYKGYIQLAMRSGQFSGINASEVYADAYSGRNNHGEPIIDWDANDLQEGNVVGYVCSFRLTNGFEKSVYWTRAKVEAHAKRFSKAYNSRSSPWKSDFDAMAIKTVIKSTLSKWAPLSVEMQLAITEDQKADGDYIDAPAVVTHEADTDMTSKLTGEEADMPTLPELGG